MKRFTISKLSKEIDVQIFMLIEFLNSNGMKFEIKGFFVSGEISESVYNKALECKYELKELELLRSEELAFKFKFLKERIETLEIISFGPDAMLEEKYKTALGEF